MVKVLAYTWTGDLNFANLRKNILGHTIFPNFEVFRQEGKVFNGNLGEIMPYIHKSGVAKDQE